MTIKHRIQFKAVYFPKSRQWEIIANIHKTGPPLRITLFPSKTTDIGGKMFEQEVERAAEQLKQYGINKKKIEKAVLQTCKKEGITPPKYLAE